MNSVELLKKCGLLVEMDIARSCGAGKQVTAKLVSTDRAIGSFLEGSAHFRRKLLNVIEPVPDMSLRDSTPGYRGQLSSQSPLPSNNVNRSLNGFPMISHGAQDDRAICLMQQSQLLTDDREISHPYGAGMEHRETLAERLSWAMKEAGMDDKAVAAELSRRLGRKVPWQTIQSIRRGGAKATVYIARLAQVLRCNAIWLDSGEGDAYATGIPTGQLGDLTPAAIAIAKRWQALPPQIRSKVYDSLLAYEALAESAVPEPEPEPSKGRKRPATARV